MDIVALIGILAGVVGCFVGLAGWLAGRDKKITLDSEWKGSVNAKLDAAIGLRADVNDIHDVVDEHGKQIAMMGQDIKSAHHRIDNIEMRQK